DAQLNRIKEIIETHRGKENQISAGEIGLQIGIREDATHVQVRSLIRQAIERLILPIAASSRGYYLIKDKHELDEYLTNIDGRIAEMRTRKTLVEEAFEIYYRKTK
ncbi:MAG: hypothetical protein ACLPOQ_06910, partial [Desulfobaccales bacterium]